MLHRTVLFNLQGEVHYWRVFFEPAGLDIARPAYSSPGTKTTVSQTVKLIILLCQTATVTKQY